MITQREADVGIAGGQTLTRAELSEVLSSPGGMTAGEIASRSANRVRKTCWSIFTALWAPA